jgi:16S rRNA U1498 N3-methylase RsmE
MKETDSRRQAGRTMIAAIKNEMDKPRLTESVRNDRKYRTALLTKTKTAARKVPAWGTLTPSPRKTQ